MVMIALRSLDFDQAVSAWRTDYQFKREGTVHSRLRRAAPPGRQRRCDNQGPGSNGLFSLFSHISILDTRRGIDSSDSLVISYRSYGSFNLHDEVQRRYEVTSKGRRRALELLMRCAGACSAFGVPPCRRPPTYSTPLSATRTHTPSRQCYLRRPRRPHGWLGDRLGDVQSVGAVPRAFQ